MSFPFSIQNLQQAIAAGNLRLVYEYPDYPNFLTMIIRSEMDGKHGRPALTSLGGQARRARSVR